MRGPVYSPGELTEVMQRRIEVFSKRCSQEVQEKLAKEKMVSKFGFGFIMPPQTEPSASEKAMRTDVLYSNYMAECAEINSRLHELRSNVKLAPPEMHRSGSLSDDQVNSGSDESFGKENEGAAAKSRSAGTLPSLAVRPDSD